VRSSLATARTQLAAPKAAKDIMIIVLIFLLQDLMDLLSASIPPQIETIPALRFFRDGRKRRIGSAHTCLLFLFQDISDDKQH
jgi:hypothetical protein